MLKLLLAASLALVPVAPVVPKTYAQATEQPIIPKVVCLQKDGYSAGSAFRVGPTYLLTARHVISEGQCQIDGQPVKVIYTSARSDFAILEDTRPGKSIAIDCGGFQEGHRYVAIGHARALDELTIIRLVGTGLRDGAWVVLAGVLEVQPGMSGGAILDADTLKVVGVVNAADWESGRSFSIALKDTPICGGGIA